MKKNIIYAILAIILVAMAYIGQLAYKEAIDYEKHTTKLVSYQNAGQQAELKFESFAKSLLGNLFDDKIKINIDKVKAKQTLSLENSKRYTRYFIYLLTIVLLSFFIISLRAFTFFGAFLAIETLIFGLITPILMVTIHKDIKYLGDIVLSFESKGVIGSIEKLWSSGDIVVALVILIFSVVVPVSKVLALLFVSIFMKSPFAHNIVKFFKLIGKWSMVDVFVVAVFLVYLTANNGDVSRAEIEVGLYFFLSYVIVSMIVSLTADKMLREFKKENSE
ncbi:MAG: paraquat-inducible protein A [Sulfurovum sp.]